MPCNVMGPQPRSTFPGPSCGTSGKSPSLSLLCAGASVNPALSPLSLGLSLGLPGVRPPAHIRPDPALQGQAGIPGGLEWVSGSRAGVTRTPPSDAFCFPPGSLSGDTCTISLFVVGLSPEQGFCFVPNQCVLIRHAQGTGVHLTV